jgi:hypothetical protein
MNVHSLSLATLEHHRKEATDSGASGLRLLLLKLFLTGSPPSDIALLFLLVKPNYFLDLTTPFNSGLSDIVDFFFDNSAFQIGLPFSSSWYHRRCSGLSTPFPVDSTSTTSFRYHSCAAS